MKLRAYTLIIAAFALFSSFNFGPGKNDNGVVFYSGTYDNLLREARKQNKPVILDFWASWCGPCKKMDVETFANPDLGKYVSQNYLIYKVDIDQFDGIEITDKFAIESFPSMLVLDSRGKPLEKLKGFYPPNYLEKELKRIVDRYGLFVSEPSQDYALNK